METGGFSQPGRWPCLGGLDVPCLDFGLDRRIPTSRDRAQYGTYLFNGSFGTHALSAGEGTPPSGWQAGIILPVVCLMHVFNCPPASIYQAVYSPDIS